MERKIETDDVQEDTMQAVYLAGPGKDNLEYGTVPKPKPGKGQVLIKVESVPINPSDIYAMEGKYSEFVDFDYPFVPGWEGSGTVVATGGGLHSWYLKNKRVAFSKCNEEMEEGATIKIGGTMGQYAITNAYQCVPINNNVSFNEGASFFVNPLTAIGLVELVADDRGRSVLITAAASQLGKMMIRLFQQKRIEVIATVRKEDQLKDLQENFGIKYIFNTENEDVFDELKTTLKELNCKHLLECIGGTIFGKITSLMPKKSTVVIYGNLSRKDLSDIDPFALMGREINIRGWVLNHWIEKKNLFSLICTIRKVRRMLNNNLATEIQKEFDIKDIKAAKEFYEENMSKGKVILKPWGVQEDPKEE